MNMISEFFTAKHEHLKDDYGDGSGIYVSSCSLIAKRLAEILTSEGKLPRILVLRGEERTDIHSRKMLIPLAYQGRVKWGAHVICEAEGVVYDPMLPAPVAMNDYLVTAFDQIVEIEVD